MSFCTKWRTHRWNTLQVHLLHSVSTIGICYQMPFTLQAIAYGWTLHDMPLALLLMFVCAALVKSTMESMQHIHRFGVHLKVKDWKLCLESFQMPLTYCTYYYVYRYMLTHWHPQFFLYMFSPGSLESDGFKWQVLGIYVWAYHPFNISHFLSLSPPHSCQSCFCQPPPTPVSTFIYCHTFISSSIHHSPSGYVLIFLPSSVSYSLTLSLSLHLSCIHITMETTQLQLRPSPCSCFLFIRIRGQRLDPQTGLHHFLPSSSRK